MGSEPKEYQRTTNRQNVPAIDYATGEPSILLEPQRTNLEIHSSNFADTGWAKTNCSVNSNLILAPDGTMSADEMVENSSNTQHYIQRIVSTTNGLAYTVSVFAKQGTGSRFLKLSGLGLNAVSEAPIFNLINGTVTIPSTTAIFKSASIEPYNNGWYRCICSIVSNGTGSPAFEFTTTNTAHGTTTYVGDGVSSIYLWGAQLEAGSYATSYIPTTTATVTRIADNINTLTDAASLIGQTEGFIFVEATLTNQESSGGVIVELSDGTVSNMINLIQNSAGRLQAGITVSNTGIFLALRENTFQHFKVVFAYKNGEIFVCYNGSIIRTETDVFGSFNLNRISIGRRYNNTLILNGNIHNVMIGSQSITKAEAIALTTL